MATWLDNILNVKKWVIFSKNQICQGLGLNKSRIALGQPANIHEQQVPLGGCVPLKGGENTNSTYAPLVLGNWGHAGGWAGARSAFASLPLAVPSVKWP